MSAIKPDLAAAFTAEMDKVETRKGNRKSPLEHFHEILNRLSPAALTQPIHIVSKRVFEAIQKQSHPSTSRNPLSLFESYAGIHLTMKENQTADCLIFHQRETAEAYLAGIITEDELPSRSAP